MKRYMWCEYYHPTPCDKCLKVFCRWKRKRKLNESNCLLLKEIAEYRRRLANLRQVVNLQEKIRENPELMFTVKNFVYIKSPQSCRKKLRIDSYIPLKTCLDCTYNQGFIGRNFVLCKFNETRKKVAVKKRFICNICGYSLGEISYESINYHLERHLDEYRLLTQDLNILMNIWIIRNPKTPQFRKSLAVYRLYKFLSLHPKTIAMMIDVSVYEVVRRIAEILAFLS